ncbi:hypothetical protein [Paraglaciecola aestuariivivens]
MGFDIYSDFIQVMMGDEPQLLDYMAKLITHLEQSEVRYCFAGDLAFSQHGIEQCTVNFDIFIHQNDLAKLSQNADIGAKNAHLIYEKTLKRSGSANSQSDNKYYRIKVLPLDDSLWQQLTVEPTLSAFGKAKVKVVAKTSLVNMVNIIRGFKHLTDLETNYFDVRLMQMQELDAGIDPQGYTVSWAELQQQKRQAWLKAK